MNNHREFWCACRALNRTVLTLEDTPSGADVARYADTVDCCGQAVPRFWFRRKDMYDKDLKPVPGLFRFGFINHVEKN